MKAFFTALAALWLQCNVAAQQLPLPSNQTILSSDTLNLSSFNPDSGNLPVKPEPDKKFLQANSRELRIAERSLLVLAAAGGAGALTYQFVDEPLRRFTLEHRNNVSNHIAALVQPLGRSAYLIPTGGLVYASGLLSRNEKLQRTGVLLVSSMYLNDFFTKKLKEECQRRRPDAAVHNYYFEGSEAGRHNVSFPSSHTSTAFTFATSVATVYHDHKWVPPVAYGMATLVGLSRIHDNKHWATDVMAGAALGFMTAKTTYYLLNQAEKQLQKRKINIYVTPNVSANAIGLNLGGTL